MSTHLITKKQLVICILCITLLHYSTPKILSKAKEKGKSLKGKPKSKNATVKKPSGDQIYICAPYEPTKYVFPSEWDDCKSDASKVRTSHPLDGKRTKEILETYGYSVDTHNVKTSDGYILTVYRMTGHLDSPTERKPGKPIYINHGMVCNSDFWFFQPKERTLPVKLFESGFDVWISNARGSSYSLNHTKYNSTSDIKYWDFSYHEMAVYDVPAVTNTIIQTTGYQNILYIGYSMGTTEGLIALAEIPDLNQKIQAMFLLAPTAYLGHTSNTVRILARFLNSYEAYLPINQQLRGRLTGSGELKEILGISTADMCSYTASRCGMCDNVWFALFGYNAPQMNRTELPNILARFPNLVSVKTVSHYAQFMSSCKFQKYNYNKLLNMDQYGSVNPPEYKLEDIKSDMYFYHSSNDNFGTPVDVNKTASKFSPGVIKGIYWVPEKWFTHLDFIMAKDADILVYDRMIIDMKKYQ